MYLMVNTMTKEAVLKTQMAGGLIRVSPLVKIIDLDNYKLYLYGDNLYGAVFKEICKGTGTIPSC